MPGEQLPKFDNHSSLTLVQKKTYPACKSQLRSILRLFIDQLLGTFRYVSLHPHGPFNRLILDTAKFIRRYVCACFNSLPFASSYVPIILYIHIRMKVTTVIVTVID